MSLPKDAIFRESEPRGSTGHDVAKPTLRIAAANIAMPNSKCKLNQQVLLRHATRSGNPTPSVMIQREDWGYSKAKPPDPYNIKQTDAERSLEKCHDAERQEVDNGQHI